MSVPPVALIAVLTILNLLSSQSRAEAPRQTYAFCQVKLLKVATEGVFEEFAEHGQMVGKIHEITYNFNLKGKARVIFISSHLRNPDETCIIDAVTLASGEPDGVSCPDYAFHEVRTTCR